MATSFDELVERLLYDVALFGGRGFNFEELTKAVKEFYAEREQPSQQQPSETTGEQDLLFSDAPPSTKSTNVVDDSFVDVVWHWLEGHPDVEILTDHETEFSTNTQDGSAVKRPNNLIERRSGKRISTTPARIWHSITGHGVDYNRVPQKEFDILCVVASYGSKGVLQPDVTKITGQDKRSVPKRTDKLAEKHYIIKETVLAKNMKTSLLKLTRFATGDTTQMERVQDKGPATSDTGKRIIYYDQWYDATIRLLRENGGIIAFQDLRIALDIHKKPWETKAFSRCIKRLAEGRLIRKVKAKIQSDHGHTDAGDRWIRSLQMTREPTEDDRILFALQSDPIKRAKAKAKLDSQAARDVEEQESADDDILDEDIDEGEAGQQDKVPEDKRVVPQWPPDMSYYNFLFELIDSAGPDGISSMDLHARANGQLYLRPLDDLLCRLTDNWETSQPPHLRHLSIVRDTGVQGRHSHYQYRSLRNFKKAVEEGQAEWEVILSTKVNGKGKKKDKAGGTAELDEFGFPKLSSELFAGTQGRGSLFECQSLAREFIRRVTEEQQKATGAAIASNSARVEEVGDEALMKKGSGRRKPGPKPKALNEPKSISDSNRTPRTPIRKDRTAVENVESDHAQAVRSESNIPTQAEVNQGLRKRTMEPANLGDSARKRKSPRTYGSALTSAQQEASTMSQPSPRIQEIESNLLSRTRPGVYINPPGIKGYNLTEQPRRAMIAVFKTERLMELECFKKDQPRITPAASRPSTHDIGARNAVNESEGDTRVAGARQGEPVEPAKKKPRTGSGGSRRWSPTSELTFIPTYTPLDPVKKKSGRPSKAMIAERERQRVATLGIRPPLVIPSEEVATIPAGPAPDATPSDVRKSSFGRRIKNKLVEDSQMDPEQEATPPITAAPAAPVLSAVSIYPPQTVEPAPETTSTAREGKRRGASQTGADESRTDTSSKSPPQATEASLITPSASKKKRGRPSKADLAERERLRKEEIAGKTLVVKLPVPLRALQQQGAQDVTMIGSEQLLAPVPSASPTADALADDNLENSPLVVRLLLTRSSQSNDIHPIPQNDETSSGSISGRRLSLIAKLPWSHSMQSRIESARQDPDDGHVSRQGNSPTAKDTFAHGLNIVRPYMRPSASQINTPLDFKDFAVAPVAFDESTIVGQQERPQATSGDDESTPMAGVEDHLVDDAEDADHTSISSEDEELEIIHPASLDRGDDEEYAPSDASDVLDGLDDTELPKLVRVDTEGPRKQFDTTPKKAGVARSGGSVQLQRSNIVLEIMKKANGVYPGKRDMWFPFCTQWFKLYRQRPDRHTTDHAVDHLISESKLKRYKFEFLDRQGRGYERDMIMLSNVDPSSLQAKSLQRAMMDAAPKRFFPPEIEISKDLRNKANSGYIPHAKKRQHDHMNMYDSSGPSPKARKVSGPAPSIGGEYDPFDWDDFPVIDGVTVKRTAQALALGDFEPVFPGYKDADMRKRVQISTRYKKFCEPTPANSEQVNVKKTPRRTVPGRSAATGQSPGRPRNTADIKQVDWNIAKPASGLITEIAHLSLLTDPGTIVHASSGTFGTDGIARITSLSAPIVHRMLQGRSVKKHQSMPANLDDILHRAEALGYAGAERSDSTWWQFDRDVDRIEAWEVHLTRDQESLVTLGERGFVNHSVNCVHEVSEEAKEVKTFKFVDGFTRASLAEKRRISEEKALKKPAKHSTPSSNKSSSQPPSAPILPTYLVGGTPFRFPLHPSAGYSLPVFSQTLQPGPELPKAPLLPLAKPWPSNISISTMNQQLDQTPVPKGTSMSKLQKKYIYKTRSKGKASPQVEESSRERANARDNSKDNTAAVTKHGEYFRDKDSERLTIAVALVGTLCSGAHDDRIRDWNIVAHALGFKYSTKTLQERWKRQAKQDGTRTFLQRLRQALQEPFLAAYENGKLPNVDFGKLQNTDWPALIRWVESDVLPLEREDKTSELPVSSKGLDIEVSTDADGKLATSTHDQYFKATESDRVYLAASMAFCERVQDKSLFAEPRAENKSQDRLALAKSWARATVVTQENKFNEKQASAKLAALDPTQLEKATKVLIDARTIIPEKKGRRVPGRNFFLAMDAMSEFQRWQGGDEEFMFLREVAAARTRLMEHFKDHDELELPHDVSETHMIVLTNMVTQGLLKITANLPDRNDDFEAPFPRISQWPHPDPQVTTKQVDGSLFRFPNTYTKTSSFTAEHGLKTGIAVPMHPPACVGEPGLRIPFWVDIHGNFLPDHWEAVLRSVSHLLVFRTGCTAKDMEKAHKHHLWAWEIDLVLGWMEKAGVAQRLGAGVEEDGVWTGGWMAGEFWYCTFLPDVASWKAPNGTVEEDG